MPRQRVLLSLLCVVACPCTLPFRVAPRRPASLALRATESDREALKGSLLDALLGAEEDATLSPLACPRSLSPLRRELRGVGVLRQSFVAEDRRYPSKPVRGGGSYVDLVAEAPDVAGRTLQQVVAEVVQSSPLNVFSAGTRLQQTGQEMFRSPTIAFLYERGWRQNFRNAGFRPEDEEFAEILRFFGPVVAARRDAGLPATVLDLSCGSGLWTRRLLATGTFDTVFAGDYSDAMLTETLRRIRDDGLPVEGPRAPVVVRLDAAALPFRTESLGAIHAGAALHCWPQLDDSVAEIYRALAPGGRFYATTFLKTAYGLSRSVGGSPRTTGFRFFDMDELEDIMARAGFPAASVDVRRVGNGCAIVKCVKEERRA